MVANCTPTLLASLGELIGNPTMAELTLGVDCSDAVTRAVVVNGSGQVLSREQLPPAPGNIADAIGDTARKAIAGAGGKVSALAAADNVGGDLSRITANDVFEAARMGDGVCISVVRDTANYVGMAVAIGAARSVARPSA